MNKQGRKQLEEAMEMLRNAELIATTIKEEEEEKYENMPESFQLQEIIDTLDSCIISIEEAYTSLEEVLC